VKERTISEMDTMPSFFAFLHPLAMVTMVGALVAELVLTNDRLAAKNARKARTDCHWAGRYGAYARLSRWSMGKWFS
jgi:uncharacterized membrane protein